MIRKSLRLGAVACLLAVAACGPTTNSLLAEMSDDPLAVLFSPITLPMGAVYDGIYHATGATAQDISGALDGAIAVTGAATSAVGAYQGASGGGYSGGSYGGSGGGNISQPNGYSQRGALEDCARLAQQVGDQKAAQQCAKDANNMSSLRPVK